MTAVATLYFGAPTNAFLCLWYDLYGLPSRLWTRIQSFKWVEACWAAAFLVVNATDIEAGINDIAGQGMGT